MTGTQELAQPFDLRCQLRLKLRALRTSDHKTDAHVELPLACACVGPADHLIVPEQRQRIVTPEPLLQWRVRFETIWPAPELFETGSVPHDRIERRKKTHRERRVIALALRRRQADVIDTVYRHGV